VKLHYT
nr:Chain B, SARS-CoV-2 Spike KxHxx motif [Severe acute respiratory syndrome coronavirus 2]